MTSKEKIQTLSIALLAIATGAFLSKILCRPKNKILPCQPNHQPTQKKPARPKAIPLTVTVTAVLTAIATLLIWRAVNHPQTHTHPEFTGTIKFLNLPDGSQLNPKRIYSIKNPQPSRFTIIPQNTATSDTTIPQETPQIITAPTFDGEKISHKGTPPAPGTKLKFKSIPEGTQLQTEAIYIAKESFPPTFQITTPSNEAISTSPEDITPGVTSIIPIIRGGAKESNNSNFISDYPIHTISTLKDGTFTLSTPTLTPSSPTSP